MISNKATIKKLLKERNPRIKNMITTDLTQSSLIKKYGQDSILDSFHLPDVNWNFGEDGFVVKTKNNVLKIFMDNRGKPREIEASTILLYMEDCLLKDDKLRKLIDLVSNQNEEDD